MKICLPDLEATLAMGALLGSAAQEGMVFAVLGDLGAGKTSLAQGMARGLGVPESAYVNSPTFTLHQRHHGRCQFHHIDLYRLCSPDEIVNLGLRELVGVVGVSYIEWPIRAPDLLPEETVWLKLSFHEGGRALEFAYAGEKAKRYIETVCIRARSDFECV